MKRIGLSITRVTLVIFVMSSLLTGCKIVEIFNKNDKSLPKWTISINKIVKYPRGSITEKQIPTFSGDKVWIKKKALLNSTSIKEVNSEPIKNMPGFCKLKLKLDRHGALVAMRLSNSMKDRSFAFVVDGMYYRRVKFDNPPLEKDFSKIVLDGPFSKTIADFLSEYAPLNYEYFKNQN